MRVGHVTASEATQNGTSASGLHGEIHTYRLTVAMGWVGCDDLFALTSLKLKREKVSNK
jgi:hypothetical protein